MPSHRENWKVNASEAKVLVNGYTRRQTKRRQLTQAGWAGSRLLISV
jgi:predicted transglutaminase-like cysteine proteinase